MKSISTLIKNIGNILPYFLLIAIYFFFVNLEATKDENNDIKAKKGNIVLDKKSTSIENNLRIKIPVIPYNK